jgi:hypothetical protein
MQASEKNRLAAPHFSLTRNDERNKILMYGDSREESVASSFSILSEKEVAVMDAGSSSTGTASPLLCGNASDVPLWRPAFR